MKTDSEDSAAFRIGRFVNPQLFLDRNEKWVLQSELQNSTMLAVLHLLAKDDHPFRMPFYLATIDTDAALASPVIIGPVAMLGFLERGGTDEGQAICRACGQQNVAHPVPDLQNSLISML